MSLNKEDPEVKCTQSIITTYDMPIFAVDLIKDAYDNTDPFFVARILKEVFEIDDLSIDEITQLIHYQEETKVDEEFTISSHNFFNS